MKTLIIITILILFPGCSMENNEIIKARKKCKKENMFPLVTMGFRKGTVKSVACIPMHTAKKVVKREIYMEYKRRSKEERNDSKNNKE